MLDWSVLSGLSGLSYLGCQPSNARLASICLFIPQFFYLTELEKKESKKQRLALALSFTGGMAEANRDITSFYNHQDFSMSPIRP